MTLFRATSKPEAGRKLALIEREILAQAPKFNSRKVIPLLLCLEDAVNNLEISISRTQKINKKFEGFPKHLQALVYFIFEWYEMINKIIIAISDDGFCDPTTKIELAGIYFAVSLEEDYEQDFRKFVDKLRAEKEIGQKIVLHLQPRRFLNRFPGAFCFILRNDVSKHVKHNLDRIFSFRDLLYQKGLLETMIYGSPEGTEVKFGEHGLMEITYPSGFLPESMYENMGLTPRMMETYTYARDWNSYFLDVAMETIQSVEEGKGKTNLNNLKKEDEETYKAYYSMKDYPKTFKKMYGVDLESFFGVIFEMTCMCYNNVHTIGIWNLHSLLNEKRLKNKFGYKTTKKVIELLSDQTESKSRYDGLIILGDTVMTSFRRLGTSRLVLLQRCFNEIYENDLKGKAFEEACRKMLREKGFKTIPTRVDILEPMLPLDISNLLWGKLKAQTDIDVIACSNNNILVIECKEIKWHLPTHREQNQFEKYLIEHYYRVKWILSNLKKFENYVGHDQWISLGINNKRPVYFFPLLVSNVLVNLGEVEGAPLVTFLELKDITSKEWVVKGNGESGELETKIGGRVIKLPWFSSMINDPCSAATRVFLHNDKKGEERGISPL